MASGGKRWPVPHTFFLAMQVTCRLAPLLLLGAGAAREVVKVRPVKAVRRVACILWLELL